MASDIHKGEQLIGFLLESGWASPNGAAAAFQTLAYDAATVIPDPKTTVGYYDWTSQAGIMKEHSRKYTDSVSVLPTVSFSALAEKKMIAGHLAAMFQYVSEGATTPYTKTYKPADDVLDYPSDEGYTFTVCGKTSSSDGWILENAILNNLTFTIDPNGSGAERFMKMSGEWIGTEMNLEQNLNGSWVALPGTPAFYNSGGSTNTFTLALTIDSTALTSLCYRKFELVYNNNVTSDCKTAGGKANNYKLNPSIQITIDIPYNSATYIALKDFQDGSNCDLVGFNNGTDGTSDGGFGFAFDNMVMTQAPFIFEGDYVALRLVFDVLRPASGWANAVTMSDTKDWTF